ncbi:hypothetical protein DAI22_05g269500 [Oryza sativa Japonica Group]|nr:hypothetical protein DAI22_05g269500 [Oryza sativa Japonica Group]
MERPRVNDGENGINISLVATCNDGVLPVDLLHDILLRLPARPLCRLRAVCRPWCALLSDPSFVAAHAARHPGPHLAVAVRGRLNAYGRESPPGNVKTWDKYVAVVDGVAYFVLRDEFLLSETGGGDWITAFDVEAEQWRPELVGGPPETFHNRLRVSLAALRGSLVVAQDDHQAGTLDLWFLLAGDGGKVGPQHWSKLYTVTMPYHGRPFRLDGERAEPVVVLDDGRIVFWVWERRVSSRGGVMRVYDPNTGGQTDVAAEANCVHVGVYTGSLLRPR